MICKNCSKETSSVFGTLISGVPELCCRMCWSIWHLDRQIDVGMSLLKGIKLDFHILNNEARTSTL